MDKLHPTLRSYAALAVSFAVATSLRSACFNPRLPIFGRDLAQNLAPIERNDVSWSWIAAVRVLDLVTYIYIWHRETGGHKHKTDAPLLGALLQSISRVPLYLLISHHFLLSTKTLGQVFITDIFAYSAALWIISKIEPKAPAFFKHPSSDAPIATATRDKLEMLAYALGLSTTVNALYSYIAERAFMQKLIRDNVLEHEIPAFLSAARPSFAYAMQHPTIAIPVLRSALSPMSMPAHLLHAVPLAVTTLLLSFFYLPQKSPSNLAFLVFLLVAPSNALSTFNLLPVSFNASLLIGLDNGWKAAVAAYITAWATEDWRRPGVLARQRVLKDVTQGTGDVVLVGKDSVTFRSEVEPIEITDDEQEAVVVE